MQIAYVSELWLERTAVFTSVWYWWDSKKCQMVVENNFEMMPKKLRLLRTNVRLKHLEFFAFKGKIE